MRSCCEVVQKLMYGKVLHPPEQENCKQVLDQGSCTGFTQDIKKCLQEVSLCLYLMSMLAK